MSQNQLTVTLAFDIDEIRQFCEDILTTAIEGGIGYWANCEWDRVRMTPEQRASVTQQELDRVGNVWRIRFPEDCDRDAEGEEWAEEFECREITWIEVWSYLKWRAVSTEYRLDGNDSILSGLVSLDAGQIDAWGADEIIQNICFGKLVYG
jgi:hypothetical protein